MDYNSFSIYGLNAGEKMATEISQLLKTEKAEMEIIRFADGEILCRALNSARGKDIYLIQSTCNPVNENLMELLIAIDALKRGSAQSINVVIPYFGYARQDRKAKGRQPITCKLIANMLTAAGATKVITVDLHSPQSVGFFDIPVDNLKTTQEFSKIIIDVIKKEKIQEQVTIVSPDHGGLIRARQIAEQLGDLTSNIAVIDKRRPRPNVSEVEFVLGEVKNKICFIVDDIIDTAGTICNAAKAIKNNGAKEVYILACHGVLSHPAKERLTEVVNNKIVKKIIVTNTIDITPDLQFPGLEVASIAGLLAEIIEAMINKNSLSKVYYKNRNLIDKFVKEIETQIIK